MAVIEGVGDEVTVSVGLLAAALLALAWFSTRTAERGGAPASAPRQGGGERLRGGAAWDGPAGPSASEDPPHGGPGRPTPLAAGGPGRETSPGDDDTIVLRLKFLNDTERLARVRPQDTVGGLKRAHFPGQERLVRLIYQGRWLRDDSQTLRALRLAHHSVLHCHLPPPGSPPRRPPPGSPAAEAEAESESASALDVGGLMVPLLALLLAALWYLQTQHRHAFSATASACLAGLTLLLALLAFALYRR